MIRPEPPTGNAAAVPTPFRIRERARWSDVDAAGIVCYGAYLRFFELAETELFRAAGLPIAAIPARFGLWLVRRRVECDFHRPVRLDDEVEIHAWIGAIGRTSLELGFLARRVEDDAWAAESRYVAVAVDGETMRPVPVPAAMRGALERYHPDPAVIAALRQEAARE